MLDNSKIIAEFCPKEDDGDTFIYTEMLDRSSKKGNNGHRLVKSFFHRSQAEFWEQWPTIKELCDMTKTRAYTRLATRSYEKVGKAFTQLVVEAAMQGNWHHMKALYNSACGRTPPTRKLWLWDVDDINDPAVKPLIQFLQSYNHYVATIPSKKGIHLISNPFDVRLWEQALEERGVKLGPNVSLHKDNPTNLYIPEGAA